MRKATVTLSLAATVLAGCSGDLSVKSDLGEEVIVKKSAVTVSTWGKEDAEEQRETWKNQLATTQGFFDSCLKLYGLTHADCMKSWGDLLETEKENIASLKRFIDDGLTLNKVRYREISVDLNGQMTAAADYTTIVCLPKTFDDEQSIVASRASKAASLDLVESDGVRVKDSVKWKVCQKFGGS